MSRSDDTLQTPETHELASAPDETLPAPDETLPAPDETPPAPDEMPPDPSPVPGLERVTEPEVVDEPLGSSLVVTAPPRRNRLSRWLKRVADAAPGRSASLPPALIERLDALEVQLAAHEEQTAKRLEENEGRTLHLLEQRLAALEEELAGSLERRAEREVRAQLGPLRSRLAIVALLALAAGAIGTLALLRVTSIAPF